MAKRVTIADVAKHAGVSVATVDRVLSKRRNVRPETAVVVRSAAASLGFYAAPLLNMRVNEMIPKKTLGFVLQKKTKSFYKRLAEDLAKQSASLAECRATTRIKFVGELSVEPIIRALRELVDDGVDSIGVVALEHPHLHDEIERLSNQGVAVWSLLSNLSSPHIAGFIGIDARKAGRTSAWAMARCARPQSSIGVLIGSFRYRSHEDREGGFRSYFGERHPEFQLLQSISYLDNSGGAFEAVSELISKHEDLGGIYLVGGGARGAIEALFAENAADRIAFVCHELTTATRNALIDGAIDFVVDSPTQEIARHAVRALSGLDTKMGFLDFRVFVSENV